MEKRERVKQNSATQSKSNSRTGGKEPICTNAHVTSMEEVTGYLQVEAGQIQCWDLIHSYRTVFQQDLQCHVPEDHVFKYCLWKALLCSLSLSSWCISREWLNICISDILPCLPLNHPSLQGIIEFHLKRLLCTHKEILFRFKHNVLRTSIDDVWTGKDKSRPRVALRWVSLATCRISSLVTSRRISVSRVFVMII